MKKEYVEKQTSLAVSESFRNEYKVWCVKHGYKMKEATEAIITAYMNLDKPNEAYMKGEV